MQGFSETSTAAIALSCSGITLLSERFLRSDVTYYNDSNGEWFSTECIDDIKLLFFIIPGIQLIAATTFSLAGAPLFQDMSQFVSARNIKMIAQVALIEPICQEILLRGFLQDRVHDVVFLVNRYIYPLDKDINWIVQGIAFGALHIKASRSLAINTLMFIATGLSGVFLTIYRSPRPRISERSLLNSIGAHLSYKISALAEIVTFRR